ncbi:hypothetical protein KIK02_04670 [Leptodesmis sichuanensis A121]|nr:hypothetical protein KIK02_04670 [Leptodesmis sichuanensis A121]
MHSILLPRQYVAAAPEQGRQTFLDRMRREIEHIKRLYPNSHYQGLADGAPESASHICDEYKCLGLCLGDNAKL